MSIKLDLSKFKHMSSDKHSTTLQHPNGHTITLAHKSLNEENRKQLEAMAKGGQIKSQNEIKDKEHNESLEKQRKENNEQHDKFMSEHEKIMQKSKIKHYDEGGDVDDDSSSGPASMMKTIAKLAPMAAMLAAEGGVVGTGEIGKEGPNDYAKEHNLPCLNPNCKAHGTPHPNCRCYGGGGEWGRMAKGGKVTSCCAEGMPHDKDCEYYKEGGKVGDNKSRYSNEQGVHTRLASAKPGTSLAGEYTESANRPGQDKELRTKQAKSLHSQTLNQLKNMPKPKLQGLAEGGQAQETPAQAANRKQMELMTKGAQEGGAEQRTTQSDTNKQAEDEARFADGGDIMPPGMQKPESETLDYKKLKKEYIEKKKQIKIDNRGKMPRQRYAEGTTDAGSAESNVEDYKKHAGDVIGHAVNSLLSHFKGSDEQVPAAVASPAPEQAPNMTPMDQQSATSGQSDQPQQGQQQQPQGSPQADQDQEDQQQQQPSDSAPQAQQQASAPQQNQKNMPEYNEATKPVLIEPGNLPNEAQQHALDFQNDLANGHIEPKTMHQLMYDGKGTFGKIGTLFGLMVSGMGSGLTGQPNALINMMQQQINNDIASQSKSKENAQNLLRLNQQYVRNNADVNLTNQQANALANTNANNNALSMAYQNLVNETDKMPNGPMKDKRNQVLGTLFQALQGRIKNSSAALEGMKQLGNLGVEQEPSAGGSSGSAAANSPVDESGIRRLRINSQMGVAGAPSAGEVSNMLSESGKIKAMRSFRDSFNRSYDELDKAFLANKLSPNLRNAYETKLTTELSKTAGYGRDAAQEEVNKMLPAANDWGKTRKVRRDLNNQNFNTLESGLAPTLQNFNLLRPPNTAPNSQQPSAAGDQSKSGRPMVNINGKWFYK